MARVRHRDGQVDSTAWREGKRKQIAAINLSACKSHTTDRHTEERGCNITGCVRVTAADKEDTGSPSGANEKWETERLLCVTYKSDWLVRSCGPAGNRKVMYFYTAQ